MRIFFVVFLVSGICLANYASSVTPIRCDSKSNVSLVSVFETAENSYINTKYRCDCLSSVHDSNHFIRVR